MSAALICPRCRSAYMQEVHFIEEERKDGRPTGRVRYAVSHLECPICFKKEIVDGDYNAGHWYYPTKK